MSSKENVVKQAFNYNEVVAGLLCLGCCALVISVGLLLFILPEDEPFTVVDRVMAKSRGVDESIIDKMIEVNVRVHAARGALVDFCVFGIVAVAVSIALSFRAKELKNQLLRGVVESGK
jgi:hypothetical protein